MSATSCFLRCFLVLTLGSALLSQSDFESARKRYEECLRRPPLLMKTRGREALARTADARAIQILKQDYRRAKPPVEQVRTTIASLVARFCNLPEHQAAIHEWREAHRKAGHFWLWYRSLEVDNQLRDLDPGYALLRDKGDAHLRVTAFEALRCSDSDETVIAAAREILGALPSDAHDRSLLVEGVVSALSTRDALLDRESCREALRLVIAQLDDRRCARRTKLVIARYLARLFRSESRSLASRSWLNQLEIGQEKKVEREEYATSFFQIPASGDRICYLIDMSDSMLTPVPEKLRQRGRTTGTRTSKKPKKNDPFVDSYDIPWHRVKTRFDLAREHLKLSLYALKKDKSFAVIGFGDRAELLPGCKGMMPATRRNIRQAIKQLDAVSPGPPALPARPHGTLRGKTNLHGALTLAFRLKKKGVLRTGGAIDAKAFNDGADTLFVLSDGDPTWDDYEVTCKDYGEDQAGDPETRRKMTNMEQMVYPGPFRDWRWIHEDTRRLNLFRRAEIHCVAIGEVAIDQLRKLSKIGLGETRRGDL